MANAEKDREDRAKITLRTASDEELVVLLAHAVRGDAALPGIYEPLILARLIRSEQARRAGGP